MTLNTARKIEAIIVWILYIMLLPIALLAALVGLAKDLLNWILECRDWIAFKVGHKLMHMSDAVKNGIIKNPDCLKNYTARMAWKGLKEEEKSGKEEPNKKQSL